MTKRFTILVVAIIVLSLICLPSLSSAECAHAHVSHQTTIYHNHGDSGHTHMTACKCNDCGQLLGCHPAIVMLRIGMDRDLSTISSIGADTATQQRQSLITAQAILASLHWLLIQLIFSERSGLSH